MLDEAHLEGADLGLANLHGASLSRAHMAGSALPYANLQGARLNEADLSGAELSGARLDAATLYRTRLIAASLHDAYLSGASLNDTELLAARLDVKDIEAAFLNGVVVGLAEGHPEPGKARIVSLNIRPQLYKSPARPSRLMWVLQDWSNEDYAALLAKAESFPRNDYGNEARKRVARLDPSAHIQEDPSVRDGWKRLEDSSLTAEEFRQKLTAVLSRTACAADGAPYVAAAVINLISVRQTDVDAKALTGQLLDEANCPGAHGLSDQAQRYLRNLVQTAPD